MHIRRLLRSVGRVGLAVGLILLGSGLLLVVLAAMLAGGWWQARQPWIGLGLDSIVGGLLVTAIFASLRVIVEPVGWLRLLAIPPAAVVAVMAWAAVTVGLATTGMGGAAHDVATILYSVPELLVVAATATLLIPAPLLIARLAKRPTRSTGAST